MKKAVSSPVYCCAAQVYHALNALGNTPWTINRPVLDAAMAVRYPLPSHNSQRYLVDLAREVSGNTGVAESGSENILIQFKL